VFQDGEGMKNVKGRWRVPTVFDNLIAQGDMPPTIAVFINPGHEKDKPRQNGRHSNRSLEYDSLGDRYVRFLLEEIIPEVRKKYAISDDPEMHAIGGSSSGAICAFTAAWERTDFFRKVCAAATSIRRSFARRSPSRFAFTWPIRAVMWTMPLEAGRGRTSRWRRP
jgi:enterochelin esterase-like enzyme